MRTKSILAFFWIFLAVGSTACGQVEADGGGAADDDGEDDDGEDDDGGDDEGGAEGEPDSGDVPLDLDLIDDLEDGDGRILVTAGRQGSWYTVNDTTGTQEPAAGLVVEPVEGGAGGSAYSVRTSGSGFREWGAKLAFVFNEEDNPAAIPRPYDASEYAGLHFQARGDVTIRVVMMSSATTREENGGTCVQDPKALCDDYHGSTIMMLTPDWQAFKLPFLPMDQHGWGKDVGLLNPATAIGVEFEIAGAEDGITSFEIFIDDVAFYREPAPSP